MQGLMFKAGETYHGAFTTVSPNTMQLKNADTSPTISATRNNTLDSNFTFTVTNPATGEYSVAGTIPAYTKGDNVQVFANVTVDGVSEKIRIGYFRIDTKLAGDLKDFDYAVQECKLTSDYNASKVAASQSSVNAIPTNPLLTNDSRIDGVVSAIDELEGLLEHNTYGLSALQILVDTIPTNPLLTNDSRIADIINYIDEIESLLEHNTYGLSALKTLIDTIPTNPLLTNDSRIDAMKTQIDKLLFDTDSLLKVSVFKGGVVFPPLNLTIPKNEIGKDKTVIIKRGDTRSIPINLNKDCTGWVGVFAAKEDIDDVEYYMPKRDVRWADISVGIGFVDITSMDTANIGYCIGEIELTQGNEVVTVEERIRFKIVKDIVKP